MGKYLVPIGVVWVGLALVVGLVVMFGSYNNMPVVGEKEVVKEFHYSVGPNQNEGVESSQGLAEVDIAGTHGYAGEKDLQAKVEVE